jgi:hypothetical protein
MPQQEYSLASAKVKRVFADSKKSRAAVRHPHPAAPRMAPSTFSSEASMSAFPDPDLKPGDEAEPGTPGAGEDLCETCGGSGKLADGKTCPECEGTGRVMRGIGGG